MEPGSESNKVLAIYEDKLIKKISLPIFNEMPRKAIQKEKKKTFKYVFNKIRLKKCASATISKPLLTYNVAYLGNVITGWAKAPKCKAKKEHSSHEKYLRGTGGGKHILSPKPKTEEEKNLLDTIAVTVSGYQSQFDSGAMGGVEGIPIGNEVEVESQDVDVDWSYPSAGLLQTKKNPVLKETNTFSEISVLSDNENNNYQNENENKNYCDHEYNQKIEVKQSNDNTGKFDNTPKSEGCIEKPLTTLWRNYIQSSRPDVSMQVTVSGGGLKAVTKNHGLTEYWAHRLTTCAAPDEFPRIFCWVYRHEGRRLRHELRCHAALCSSSEVASQIEKELKEFLTQALTDFKKEKLSRQNARLSLVNSVQDNPSLPRRKILLATGSHNYRPPLECSKSAPKLSSIEEIFGEEDDDGDLFNSSQQIYRNILKSYERVNILFEYGKRQNKTKQINTWKKEERKSYDTKFANVQAFNLGRQNNQSFKDLDLCTIRQGTLEIETEECENVNKKFDKSLYIKNDSDDRMIDRAKRVSFVSTIETSAICQNQIPMGMEGNSKEKVAEKADLDFKIGGEVLPTMKGLDKLSSIEHTFVNTIINKGFMEQEQVSLVPVGETHADFSSLKVYKKKNFSEGNKDFTACAMFLSGENINQLEHIFQAHCSFSGDRSEEEIANKINSTLLV